MHTYKILALMSGTSADGLDIAYCKFTKNNKSWDYEIISTKTVEYDQQQTAEMLNLHSLPSHLLKEKDISFAKFCANNINEFLKDSDSIPDLISSHGHTVFHAPHLNYTKQIGSGETIAKLTGIKTVFDFRTGDIILGGQGAPLVPIGDEILFSNYHACLNIGGFANISYKNEKQTRIAYDISPANILINRLSNTIGYPYDKNGDIAKSGQAIKPFIDDLNNLEYYKLPHPKSLGREWVETHILPIINNYKEHKIEDLIHSISIHIAKIIALSLKGKRNVLVTGGGTYNKFLIENIQKNTETEIVIPDKQLIDYKEAIVFGLLGALRLDKEINCLASVTGAKRDSCCGLIANP